MIPMSITSILSFIFASLGGVCAVVAITICCAEITDPMSEILRWCRSRRIVIDGHRFDWVQERQAGEFKHIFWDGSKRVFVTNTSRRMNITEAASSLYVWYSSQIDESAPDTLGWRLWLWDPVQRALISPVQGTRWPEDGILTADNWGASSLAGIYALRMPQCIDKALPHLQRAFLPIFLAAFDYMGTHNSECGRKHIAEVVVWGVVERWGNAIIGENGWRAETVAIKYVFAEPETAAAIRKAYPSIDVRDSDTSSETKNDDKDAEEERKPTDGHRKDSENRHS